MLKNAFLHLFSQSRLSRKARLAWTLLFALSPLAYLIGVLVIARTDPNTQIGFMIDRGEAIQTAARYASTQNFNVEGWDAGAKVEINNDRYFYFRLRQNEEVERARRFVLEAFVHVLFVSPDGKDLLEVWLSPDGRPLGYNATLLSHREIADPGEAAAGALAESAFRALQQREGIAHSGAPPVLSEERESNRVLRSYSWRWPLATLPELDLRVTIKVLGDKVIAQEFTSKFDSTYADKYFVNRQLPARLAAVPYGFLVFLVCCYGLYRYIQRTRQKEVPHARSLLLCGVATCAFMFLALQTDFHVFMRIAGNIQSDTAWISLIATLVVFLLMGLALGMAYGSGEGDVREAYPGKLTSLDALITGRIFSRNVARAICIGFAFGGWALLARSLMVLPWTNKLDSGPGLAEHFYNAVFGNSAWLMPLLSPPLGAIMTAIIGLLLPLSFLHRRRFRSDKLQLGILILLSLIYSLSVFQERPLPFAAGLLMAMVGTAALLVLFFTFDLLTAIIGLMAPTLVVFVIYFVSQPAASLRHAGFIAAGIAIAIAAGGLFFLLRGREYREDQVRPLYARHLAERLSLQAEVSAAREAQIRLMPQTLPEIPGLSVAAACVPARVVGGDFYDLFVFDEKRLGIFVAEGGSHGLGAALTIAFAKGFLMPRIFVGHTPAEVICGLQDQLAPMLDQDQEMAFAYAIVDTAEKTLSYARIGHYPRVMISHNGNGDGSRSGRNADDDDHFQPEERERRITSTVNPDTSCLIREATLSLTRGDAVILITDGIAKSLKADTKISLEKWVSGIITERMKDSHGSLQGALDKALAQRAKRIKRIGFEDDLTAVVVHLKSSG